jgi:hypothetical protein
MATATITHSNPNPTLDPSSSDLSFLPPPIPTRHPHRPPRSPFSQPSPHLPRRINPALHSLENLRFFYLDLRSDPLGETPLLLSSQLFSLAPKLYDLGHEELSKYDYQSVGSYKGYKGFESAVVDEKGNLDRNEFYNVCPLPPPLTHFPVSLSQPLSKSKLKENKITRSPKMTS